MKRAILLLIVPLLLVLASPAIAAGQDTPASPVNIAGENWTRFLARINDPSNVVRIAFLGDSITEKNIHTHDNPNYFDYMQCYFIGKNPRANVKNVGKSGRTTVKALPILQPQVIDFKPDLTFVMLGINDCSSWFNVPLDEYKSNLTTIISRLLEAGSAVIVMTQNEMRENPYDGKVTFKDYAAFEAAALDIAKTMGVHAIDNFGAWQKLKKENPEVFESYMSDWIHPNEEGHIFYFLTIRDEMERLLSKTPTPGNDNK